MNWLKRILPPGIRYLLKIYVIGIIAFTVLRAIFFMVHYSMSTEIPAATLSQSFLMGFRFDTVISCYILLLPFILSFLLLLLSSKRIPYRIINLYLILVYGMAFFICAADIPYFGQFYTRMTFAALNWTDTPMFMLKVMFTEPVHYLYIGIFGMMLWLFSGILRRVRFRMVLVGDYSLIKKLSVLVLVGGLLFLGIRGRVGVKSPIRWGTAFFSEYSFANQMGLNPVFTFIRTGIDFMNNEELNFMKDKEAIKNVVSYLNIPTDNLLTEESPIARKMIFAEQEQNYNVILVLMESISAQDMDRYGNGARLTPVLDKLTAEAGFVFDNFYSAGIHTFNGLHSTLYSVPALMHRHPLKGFQSMNSTNGIPIILEEHGYKTVFFTSHDAQFDNMGGYMLANGFQEIISEKDYDPAEVISTLGVPDHVLFREAIEHINRLTPDGNPFFATILTGSNHGPYVIPEGTSFKSDQSDMKDKMVQYADWSVGEFLENAASQAWFANTLFIFTSDHGNVTKPVYDMPLSYHHIPLLIYAPKIFNENLSVKHLGGQIDLFPTLMGILKMDYENNTLGTDMLNEDRRFICFSADDKLACLSDSLFYVQRNNGMSSLYKYKTSDRIDYLKTYPEMAKEMKLFSESMLQAAQSQQHRE